MESERKEVKVIMRIKMMVMERSIFFIKYGLNLFLIISCCEMRRGEVKYRYGRYGQSIY